METKYKSKLIYKDKVFYNIHHFNKFQKFIAKIFYGITIEDIDRKEVENGN